MILVKELSSLLETLYAAPLEPEQWQVFLERLCAFTNTASGCMVSVGADENTILAGAGFNFNPEILHLYSQHYGAIDPYTAPVKLIPRVGIIQAEALVSRTSLVRSELYNAGTPLPLKSPTVRVRLSGSVSAPESRLVPGVKVPSPLLISTCTV